MSHNFTNCTFHSHPLPKQEKVSLGTAVRFPAKKKFSLEKNENFRSYFRFCKLFFQENELSKKCKNDAKLRKIISRKKNSSKAISVVDATIYCTHKNLVEFSALRAHH